jgi:protein-S-isoprenylcysteine O-methyltransferase Ste14
MSLSPPSVSWWGERLGGRASALAKNLEEGQLGQRGEGLLALAAALSVAIVNGCHPLLTRLLHLLLSRLGASLLLACGSLFLANGVWELDRSMNLFANPVRDNTLAVNGVFLLVKHPVYGGLIMVCFGVSMLRDNALGILLSLALAAVLVSLPFLFLSALQ